jgi:hypothetical protein
MLPIFFEFLLVAFFQVGIGYDYAQGYTHYQEQAKYGPMHFGEIHVMRFCGVN